MNELEYEGEARGCEEEARWQAMIFPPESGKKKGNRR
jgi:hypothetical protein